MEINTGEHSPEAAHRIAKALHAKWGVGSAQCDNGVLLLLAVNDRQVYISTGVGAQQALSDNSLGSIINDMKRHLRSEQYSEAVELAVVEIGLGLAGKMPSHGGEWEWIPVLFFIIVVGIILVSVWCV